MTKLARAEIEQRLAKLDAWTLEASKLHREYQFEDFAVAFGFMTQVALAAESMNHHPEWFNVWNRVIVDLTTHDAAGISERDFDLAAKMEAIAEKLL